MSLDQLMRDFNFTEEDLVYNRRGEMSPRQNAEEKGNAQGCRRTSGIFVMVAVLVIVGGIVTGWGVLQSLSVPLGVWGVVALGAFLLTFGKYNPNVMTARGTAKLTMNHNRGATHHALIISGTYFRIGAAAYEHIEEGATYAVHYIPMSVNNILSVERVD